MEKQLLIWKPPDPHFMAPKKDLSHSHVKGNTKTEEKDLQNLAACASLVRQEPAEPTKNNESYTENAKNSNSTVRSFETCFPAKSDTIPQQETGMGFEAASVSKIPSDEEIYAFTKMFAPVSFEVFDIPSASKARPFGALIVKNLPKRQMTPSSSEICNDKNSPIPKEMTGCDYGGVNVAAEGLLEAATTKGMVPSDANVNESTWSAGTRRDHRCMRKEQRTETIPPLLNNTIREINAMTVASWINSNKNVPEIIRMNANAALYPYTNPFHFASKLDHNAPFKQQKVQATTVNNTELRHGAELQQNINNFAAQSEGSMLREILEYEATMTYPESFKAPAPVVVANSQWRNYHFEGKVYAENVPVSGFARPSCTTSCNNTYGKEKVTENLETKSSSNLTPPISFVVTPGNEINNNLVSNEELNFKTSNLETTVGTTVNKTSIQPLMQVKKEGGTSSLTVDEPNEHIIEIENSMKELKTGDVDVKTDQCTSMSHNSPVKECSIVLRRIDDQLSVNNTRYLQNLTTKTNQPVISPRELAHQVESMQSACNKPELVKVEPWVESNHCFPSQNHQSLGFMTSHPPTLINSIDRSSILQTMAKAPTSMDTKTAKMKPHPAPPTMPVINKRRSGTNSDNDATSQKIKRRSSSPKLTEAELIAKMRTEALADDPNIDDLSDWMGKTFPDRKVMLADSENGLMTLITTYPALNFYQIVKEEYGRLLSGVKQMKKLEEKLMPDLTSALTLEPRRTRFQINRHPLWKEVKERWKNNPNCDLDTKKILGMLCLSFHMVGNGVVGSLFRLRKKGNAPDVLQMVTPTLDICESQLFEKKTEMWIYVDAMKYLKVPNIYEGVLSMYAIYWVFNIEYSPELKGLFEYFDAIIKNPQSSYDGDLLNHF